MAETSRSRRIARRALKLLIVLVITAGIIEIGVRHFALGDGDPGAWRQLRSAARYSDRWDTDYWKLQHAMRPAAARKPSGKKDARLGWIKAWITPETYAHKHHSQVADRRPVLLYGDSFAGCATPPAECWEGLVAGSDLAEGFMLLNYGVGGYGIGQAYLLFRESIDLYAEERPVVVMSILVDDDLDRATLRFRGGVKPHFTLGGRGELVLELPSTLDDEEWLAENPPEIGSYAWRYLLYGTRILPDAIARPLRGRGERFAETRSVSGAILRKFRDEVRDRKLEAFVLLFHGLSQFNGREDWRETFLIRKLEKLGLPYVSSRKAIEEDQAETGRKIADYFIRSGRGKGHYNALGNQVVFASLRDGILGHYHEDK